MWSDIVAEKQYSFRGGALLMERSGVVAEKRCGCREAVWLQRSGVCVQRSLVAAEKQEVITLMKVL